MEAAVHDDSASITMTRCEALVLFDALARFEQTGKLPINNAAGELTLWRVLGALEKVLGEPFKADYLERLSAARQAVLKGA